MGNEVNSKVTKGGNRRIEKVPLYLLLGGILGIGFLLGYLASAFVPLIRPPQSPPSSPSTGTAPRLSASEIDVTLKSAHVSLDGGDLQAAWDKYHQVLMTDPHHVEAITHLGNILMRGNQLDEAIRLYDRALRFNPNYSHALFDKGQALKEKGDPKGAAESWKRFLALVSADSDDAKKVKGWLAELDKSGVRKRKDSGTQDK